MTALPRWIVKVHVYGSTHDYTTTCNVGARTAAQAAGYARDRLRSEALDIGHTTDIRCITPEGSR